MIGVQRHRGPDHQRIHESPSGHAVLGHGRLTILDTSDAGAQPMHSLDGRYTIVFNGEVYNYRELREELGGEGFRSTGDTEVVLRAFEAWGPTCLDRFVGMFAFAIWDEQARTLFAARDRFGVKPFHYGRDSAGALVFASEPKALRQLGIGAHMDESMWATWLSGGWSEYGERTFWDGISSLPAGHNLTGNGGASLSVSCWYDLAAQVSEEDSRSEQEVLEEYAALLDQSVEFRFRSDVPVGINLSGGLDSSLLLDAVQRVQGHDSDVKAFTFATGDPDYDETPWVEQMLAQTQHPSVLAPLLPAEVPELARRVTTQLEGPGGGLPTLAYAKLFQVAKEHDVTVLLDGQGMDEQWAGYDYYARALSGSKVGVVQGTGSSPLRPQCLEPDFAAQAYHPPRAPGKDLRALQLRDLQQTKIPRALRYNDRISMLASRELREPFLDHRMVGLALRQPDKRKIQHGEQKYFLRQLAKRRLPEGLRTRPKRPLQTPQREWLRGPLRSWAEGLILEQFMPAFDSWIRPDSVRSELDAFFGGKGDNSFFIWQWLELGLLAVSSNRAKGRASVEGPQ